MQTKQKDLLVEAKRSTRIMIVIYAIAKQILVMLDGTATPYNWISRAITGIVMLVLGFIITNRRFSGRTTAILIMPALVLPEIIWVAAIQNGEWVFYIFMVGGSLINMLYLDSVGLLISMVLSCGALAFCSFVLRIHMSGWELPLVHDIFGLAGVILIDILIYFICRFSVGAFAQYDNTGRTFDKILETTPSYMVVIDEKSKVEYISHALTDWLGISEREFALNRPLLDIFRSGEMTLIFQQIMESGENIENNYEVTVDGIRYWFLLRSSLMGSKKVARSFELSDITPIIEAKNEAEMASKSKGDFLARMSHEIRTPMNAITGMTELILREEITPSVRDYALSIKNAGNNLLSIINDILDFSKVESGKLEMIPSEYVFASLINDVVNIIRVRVTEKPIQFVVNLDSNIPNILIGDEGRIRQILLNLLSNALKYTQEGFICFTVEGEFLEDTIMLNIEVSDSGIGIKEEDVGKLFGDFVQVDTAAHKSIQGTGLGLAIARNLCRTMGGDITVESEYGMGSTFVAVIPQKFNEYEKFASVENSSGKEVLLYELRELFANSIACSIDNLGVSCTLVTSHEKFRNALEQFEFPFVFVSSPLFESVKSVMSELGKNSKLVLLAEYGEVVSENNIKTIAMPAHSVSIANILNDITDNAGYSEMEEANISFTAPKAKILIVDDVATNLKVAEGLMSPYNMCIETCLSGEEAINMVESTHYDIIFMDHMMPKMDGIETTRRIRGMDGEYFKTVPIIALTANAISGVKDMFIKNGMNDFLAKPIETFKLNSTLEQWIPREKKEKGTGLKGNNITVLFKIEGLDVNVGILGTGGNTDNYLGTLSLFYKDGTEKINQIKDCVESSDIQLYTTFVHALKSVLSSIGAPELSNQAKELETAGRNKDMSYIKHNTPKFLSELQVLLTSINKVVKNVGSDDAAEEIDRSLLTGLKDALAEMDAMAIGDIIEELRSQNLGKELKDVIEEIYQSILLFEYDEAQEIIDSIL